MTEYRRLRESGGTYFFTVVTFDRQPILVEPECRAILRKVWKDVQTKHPFETIKLCLLSARLHTIWRLPDGDTNRSIRWNEIKRHFTHEYRRQIDAGGSRNESRVNRRE